jgi:hypothetical protein
VNIESADNSSPRAVSMMNGTCALDVLRRSRRQTSIALTPSIIQSVLTANDGQQLTVTSMAIVGTPQGSLTFDAATQTFTYASTSGTGAAVDTLTYTFSFPLTKKGPLESIMTSGPRPSTLRVLEKRPAHGSGPIACSSSFSSA